MNHFLIEQDNKYGIYQSDKTMKDVKLLFKDDTHISMWNTMEQIQNYAKKKELIQRSVRTFIKS